MLNRCEFIGNLGRDPEIRSMQNGGNVANLSLACTEKWRDKNTGEQQERTEWVRVSVFGKLADICEQYLSKGSKVYIAGKMQTRKWQDQSGQDRYSTEIILSGFDAKLVMLGNPQGSRDEDAPYSAGDYARESRGGGSAPSAGDLDDEIPF